MTYFRFLQLFLGIPLIAIGMTHIFLNWRVGTKLPSRFNTWNWLAVTAGLIGVAVFWTTPWDNYLVATRVWWYDPDLVTGIVFGYVPVEEYTFFILQTALTSAYTVLLIKLFPDYLIPQRFRPNPNVQKWGLIILGAIWLGSTILLISGYLPATYLTLILSWALIPVLIQFWFGADILWHYRRILFWGIVPITLYLGYADHIAITAGTWTISPEKTLGIMLGPALPLEEFTFFLMTNVLVVFGMTLLLARESHERSAEMPVLKKWVALEQAG